MEIIVCLVYYLIMSDTPSSLEPQEITKPHRPQATESSGFSPAFRSRRSAERLTLLEKSGRATSLQVREMDRVP